MVAGVALHLRGEVRGIFFDWLRDQRPDLVERYEEIYRRGAYAPAEERRRLGALVARGRVRARAPSLRGRDPTPAEQRNMTSTSRHSEPPAQDTLF